jgi:hypothetical protein
MSSDDIHINNTIGGRGTLNQIGNQIGGSSNTMSGNVYHISNSPDVPHAPTRGDLRAALHQLREEIGKARDLPEDEADDITADLEAAVKALDREQPNKDRTIDKLSSIQKVLDSLKGNVGSALALGKLVGEILLAAKGLQF